MDHNLFSTLGAAVIAIVLASFIFALVFNVSKHIKLLKMQVDLLTRIAEKAGVDQAEISEIVNR